MVYIKSIEDVLEETKNMGMCCVSPSKPITPAQQQAESKARTLARQLSMVGEKLKCSTVLIPLEIDCLTYNIGSFKYPTTNIYGRYREIGKSWDIHIYTGFVNKIYFGDSITEIDKILSRKEKLIKLNGLSKIQKR